MGSVTLKLPIIDFSGLKHESPTWASTKTRCLEALEEYGCFEAIFDQVPSHVRKSMFEALRQLFDLPQETKIRNSFHRPYHGYVGQVPEIPLYESLGIDDALSHGSIDNFTNLMWQEGNPSFSKSVYLFLEQLSELDKTARRMVVEGLGLEKYMDEHIDSTNYVVRVQKYEGPQSHEPKLGLIPHTDKNILTILYPSEVKGLQVLSKDGQWISADNSPNSFIVMAGEAFHAWTNGRIHAPCHKVTMAGNEARYSIGLFSVPKDGTIIKAPQEMVDDEHPLCFRPYDYSKFIDYINSEAGRNSLDNALKAYCGA